MSTPSDRDLIDRCLAGERDAWDVLIDRYADVVFRVARRTGLDGDAAEDVVQEVSLILLDHLRRLRHRHLLLPWIVQVTRRQAWRSARRAGAAQRREEKAARLERAPEPTAIERAAAVEHQHLVRRAYATLGARCRQLLDALFFQADRPYADVSRDLGIPIGSIGPTRQRCLARLREELLALGFAPEDVSGGAGGRSSPGATDAPTRRPT